MIEHVVCYGLEFNPFIKNTKDIIMETSDMAEARTCLKYLGSTRGFGILTGSPRREKSTSAKIWASSLNPSLFKVVYSSLSTLTVMDFYRQIASGLGAASSFRKNDLFDVIVPAGIQFTELTALIGLDLSGSTVFLVPAPQIDESHVLSLLHLLMHFCKIGLLIVGAPIIASCFIPIDQFIDRVIPDPFRKRIRQLSTLFKSAYKVVDS